MKHTVSYRTCSVGGRAVAQFVANHAGEVTTNGRVRDGQGLPVIGHTSHRIGDGRSLVEPSEEGVCPPGFPTNQGGVRDINAH